MRFWKISDGIPEGTLPKELSQGLDVTEHGSRALTKENEMNPGP